MSDDTAAVASTPAPAASPKKAGRKSASKGPKKAKVIPAHPSVAIMVNAAISTLKERGGSSLQAIKKYIGANYKADVDRNAIFIKRYLKSAVVQGILVQTKGRGASGSFRMNPGKGAGDEKPKKAAKKAVAKPAKAAKKTPAKAKKAAPAADKKKPAAKVAAKKSTPKKAVKTVAKATKPKAKPAIKPKSPKVKRAGRPPGKKAAAKK